MVATPERLDAATALHASISSAIVRKRQADFDLAMLLRQCADRQLFRELGYISIAEYGEQAHGLGRAKTRSLVRLAGTLRTVPAMAEAVRSGVIPWTKAREVARVVTNDSAEEWIEHATTVTNRELENTVRHAWVGDDVAEAMGRRDAADAPRTFSVRNLSSDQHALIERLLERVRQASGIDRDDFSRGDALATVAQRVLERLDADDVSATPTAVRYQRVVHVCSECRQATGETGGADDTDVLMSDCDSEVVDLMPEEPVAPRTRVPCTASDEASPRTRVPSETIGAASQRTRVPFETTEATDRGTRGTRGTRRKTVPPSVRTAVLHRDRHTCRVPDCTNRLYLDVHHIVPRSHGGPHTEDNLLCLCASHHRLLHDGRLAIMHATEGRLRIQFAEGRQTVVPRTPR